MKRARAESEAPSFGVVGDVGGTNCRFAMVALGSCEISTPVKYRCADFPDLDHAIQKYLQQESGGRKIEWALINVAGPVVNNEVMMTNLAWHISGRALASEFGMRDVHLVNDFTAFARATPFIPEDQLAPLGGAPYVGEGTKVVGVVGAGTGLGAGGLISSTSGAFALTTEGGHTTFAPGTPVEIEIARVLRTRFGRVSNERLLSGEGLHNLYDAMCELDGVKPEKLTPREITLRAIDKSDPRCERLVPIFCRVLGAFSGDLVLTLGAQGGLYVTGGVVNAMTDIFDREAFREGFEDKGRFKSYMAKTPAWIVVYPFATLLGCAALAGEMIAPAAPRVAAKA